MFFIPFISRHFPDAATYWSKNTKCFYTPAVLITITDGDSVGEFIGHWMHYVCTMCLCVPQLY